MGNEQAGPPPYHHICVMRVLAIDPEDGSQIPMLTPYYIRLWHSDPVQVWHCENIVGPFSMGWGATFHVPIGQGLWKVDAVKALYTDPPDPWVDESDYMQGTHNVLECTWADGQLIFAVAS
jgi:hypothetical protein